VFPGLKMSMYIKCNLCESDNSKLLFVKYGYNIIKCKNCGFIYVNPRPTEDELKEFYSEKYFSGKNKLYGYENYSINSKIYIQRRIETVETYKDRGKLLDVGCATGQWLKAMSERGWETYGIELSKFASKYARDKLGLQVATGNLREQQLVEESFDVVTMWDTFEHLVNPMLELIEVHRILKKNGLVIIGTQNVNSLQAKIKGKNWPEFKPPEHLNFYTKRTLKRFLERANFIVIKVFPTTSGDNTSSILMRLLHYSMDKLMIGGYGLIGVGRKR